ncbi:MAG: hypothetical protein AB7F22_26320 [Reyranella sp.]|uniref:hypothetical protein n=1 Tax=Reyranella sp. TaxID=1929291 RepID=UPI003D107937
MVFLLLVKTGINPPIRSWPPGLVGILAFQTGGIPAHGGAGTVSPCVIGIVANRTGGIG